MATIFTPKTAKNFKFRIIFTNSDRTEKDAPDINQAAILSVADRIRQKKPAAIMCAFSRDESGDWQPVTKPKVEILIGQ